MSNRRLRARTGFAAVPAISGLHEALELGGRVVRGRIDAVFRHEVPARDGSTAVRWEVVDWKTGRAGTADPLQLAVYRLAWAEAQGVPLDEVAATFVHVASSTIERHDGLPGREELEALLSGSGGPAGTGPRTPPA